MLRRNMPNNEKRLKKIPSKRNFCSATTHFSNVKNAFVMIQSSLVFQRTRMSKMLTDAFNEPEMCSGLDDIQDAIDAIDRTVIAMLAKRFRYVRASARFRTEDDHAGASERFRAMLKQRRTWAMQEQINPDAIEKMFRDLTSHFFLEEVRRWRSGLN